MPKRKGFLYEWMCDKEHIREAIVFGAKDKHDRRDVRRVLTDVDGYTDRVYDLLQTQTFAPAQPKKRKIFDNSSRKWREIEYVPFFPDGIVHTLMVLAAAPVFLRGMNYWCCASVPGRGGKHALRRCKRVIHHGKKGSRYVCKMDVHHFYHPVDRRKLIWMLAHKIKDKKYLKLTWEILQTCEQGLAIGFFICQWLANFYLEPLDRYITTLDGVKYSVRYMDDIVLFGPNKKKLHRARKAIAEYLQKRLRLQMKGNWQVFRFDYTEKKTGKRKGRPLDFMGFQFYHDKTILRESIMLSCTRKVNRVAKKEKITWYDATAILSYMGYLSNTDTYGMYLQRVKPYVNVKKLKKIVSKHSKRKEREKHERMERSVRNGGRTAGGVRHNSITDNGISETQYQESNERGCRRKENHRMAARGA